VVVTSW